MTRTIFGTRRVSTLTAVAVTLMMIGGVALAVPPARTDTIQGRRAPMLAAIPAVDGDGIVDLCASTGTIAVPAAPGDPVISVDVWGYVELGATETCEPGMVNTPGHPFPLPPVVVAENDPNLPSDVTTVNLANALPENVSLMVTGHTLTASGGVGGDFATEAAAPGGTDPTTVSYTFQAKRGTHLLESATNPGIQVPMGLYGALVVYPGGVAGQAYGDAGSAYDVEEVLLLSEIDPVLNASPGTFDLLNYHPTYSLINGKAYPMTDDIVADPGDRVLLRYVNASFDNLSMAVLNAHQRLIAREGFEVPHQFDAVAEIVPSGATADLLVDTAGIEGPIPVYSRNTDHLINADVMPGGMMTFIQAGATGIPDVTIASPTEGATVFGTTTVAFSAVDDGTVVSAEVSVDGGATWVPPTTDDGNGNYTYEWDTTQSPDGLAIFMARATDNEMNVGSSSVTVTVANDPIVSFTPAVDSVIYGTAVDVVINVTSADPGVDVSTLSAQFNVYQNGGPTSVVSLTPTWNGSAFTATLDTSGLDDGVTSLEATVGATTVQHEVVVSNAPTGGLVSPTDGATVQGTVTIDVTASDAEDAAGTLDVYWVIGGPSDEATTSDDQALWDGDSYEALWDTTGLAGEHTVHILIVDSCVADGFCPALNHIVRDSATVTIGAPNVFHLADVDDVSVQAPGQLWIARITVNVADGVGGPAAAVGVAVDATVNLKAGGTETTRLTCTTNLGGTCSLQLDVDNRALDRVENAVTFTVIGVGDAGVTLDYPYYDPTLNVDPDGEALSINPYVVVVEEP